MPAVSISSTTRSIRAAARSARRAVFDNKDGRYTPGLFARIKLVSGESRDTILIDERAVGTDLGKKFVLALKADNTLDYRPVTLGAAIDGLRVVKEGLAGGDVIVVNGLQHVHPGVVVAPTRAAMDTGRAGVAQIAPASAPTCCRRQVTKPGSARARLIDKSANIPTALTCERVEPVKATP